jgi:hypothetical protein
MTPDEARKILRQVTGLHVGQRIPADYRADLAIQALAVLLLALETQEGRQLDDLA